MNLIFTEVSENDLLFLTDLYNYYIENTTATFHTVKLQQNEMRDILFFNNKIFKSFLISYNNKSAGYVILAPHKLRQAYIRTGEISVYLDKDYSGFGIGSKAVIYIEEFARLNSFHTLLATICADNTSSIKLFENCGYIKCAHYKEVGFKHEKYLDIVSYQKILDQ